MPSDWKARVDALPAVAAVSADGKAFHISSKDGPTTTMALLDAAAKAGVVVQTLAVQSTTLDDVFIHYTGHELRDALQEASPSESPYMMQRYSQ